MVASIQVSAGLAAKRLKREERTLTNRHTRWSTRLSKNPSNVRRPDDSVKCTRRFFDAIFSLCH